VVVAAGAATVVLLVHAAHELDDATGVVETAEAVEVQADHELDEPAGLLTVLLLATGVEELDQAAQLDEALAGAELVVTFTMVVLLLPFHSAHEEDDAAGEDEALLDH